MYRTPLPFFRRIAKGFFIYIFRPVWYHKKVKFPQKRRILMPSKNNNRIHKLYGIVTGVSAVVAGICLIAACLHIYRSGVAADAAQIYTRQIVAESFAKIAVPVYVCLALVIGGMVLKLVLPTENPRLKPEKNLPLILQRLREKTDLDACDEQLRKAVVKERHLRKGLVLVCGILLLIGFLMFLIYSCNAAHWGTNSTPSMVSAMLEMLRCLFVPFALTVATTYLYRHIILKEIDLLKQAASQAPKAAEKAAPKACRNRGVNIARIVILAAAVVLVVLGACNEGTKDILTKAVNICTECVGLG